MCVLHASFFFFFNDTATTEIYTLSLHDALPISRRRLVRRRQGSRGHNRHVGRETCRRKRSEEHTSELQSLAYLVCRLLLEKKKRIRKPITVGFLLIPDGSQLWHLRVSPRFVSRS